MNTRSLATIARLLNSRAGPSPLPALLYMTDEARAPNPLPTIRQLTTGNGVIFRHYNFHDKYNLAKEIKMLCRKRKLLFLVAGDYDLARELDADGFHLPEYLINTPSLDVKTWRQRPNKLMTAAVHSRKNLLKGGALGIDAALVSPVFPTKSHAETLTTRTTLGLLGLSKICRGSTVPIYALGGVSDKNAMQLLKSPAIGIAGISGIADNGIQG